MNRQTAIIDGVWIFCFGLASTVWCLSAAATLGATFDEPTYIYCGLEHWRTGSYKLLMRLGTMPLAVDIQTLPVHFLEIWRRASVPFAEALRWARGMTLLFWWILLFYTLRAGRMIAGNWGGRLAVAFLACEPLVLGHAALATSDVAVAACLLVLSVEFYRGREKRWPRRLALPAILYGLAILAKASALVLGPVCLLVIEAERIWRAAQSPAETVVSRERVRRSCVDVLIIMAGGLIVTVLYCGSDWTTERTFIEWAQTLPARRVHDAMLWISTHLKIFTNAGEGLVQQIKHNIRGNGAFILGHEYPRAAWFYFPAALTMKLSLSLLVGVAVIAALCRAAFRNWACLLTIVLLIYSLTFRVQIGVRLMLPVIVFLCVGLASAATIAFRQLHGAKRIVLTIWLVAGISSTMVAAVRVWPYGICFTNAAWGGTANGYRLLSDSNYDWGQGLPDLRKWARQHNVAEIDVWYFGSDPSLNVAPLRGLPLHLRPAEDVAPAVQGKLVAVSTTLLYGAYGRAPGSVRDIAAWFRERQPIDRTMTFFIYDFREVALTR